MPSKIVSFQFLQFHRKLSGLVLIPGLIFPVLDTTLAQTNLPGFYQLEEIPTPRQDQFPQTQPQEEEPELSPSEISVQEGIQLFDQGKLEEALTAFTQAIELDKKNSEAYLNRALIYHALKKYDEAYNDYTQVINLNPTDINAYFNRANLLIAQQEYGAAILNYNNVIEINPKDVDAYYYRGLMYLKLGDEESALEDFNQTIELSPRHADAFFQRATLEVKNGNLQQASSDFTRAATLFSTEGREAEYQKAINEVLKLQRGSR